MQFKTTQNAIEAFKDHEESPLIIEGREIWMNYRPLWGTRRPFKERRGPSVTIFIGNIHRDATKEDVLEALKPLGNLVTVRLGALLCRPDQMNH